MPIQGLRNTDGWTSGQRPQNWREMILFLFPNGKMPLTGLTSMMKKESTDDPRYNYFMKRFQQRRMVLGANIDAAAGAQNWTIVDDGHGAKHALKDTIVLVEQSGELVRVSADPTTNTTLAVVRGFGGTTPTAVAFAGAGINPNLIVIGTAFMEGQDIPNSIGYNPTEDFNYTQIHRTALGITRTASKTRLRTGDQVKESKREALEMHGVGIERASIWGVRSQDLTGAHPRRSSGGIVSFLAAAQKTNWAATTVTMSIFEAWMEFIFRYGSQEKLVLCGNIFALSMQQLIRKNTTYDFQQGQKEYGMNVMRVISPFGTLVLKTHPLFNEMVGGTTGGTPYVGYNSAGLVLDMENIRYRYLKDSDTKYLPNRQSNGLDGMQSEYLSECGLEVHFPETHHLVQGFQTTGQG
jgi:hypothetical protein